MQAAGQATRLRLVVVLVVVVAIMGAACGAEGGDASSTARESAPVTSAPAIDDGTTSSPRNSPAPSEDTGEDGDAGAPVPEALRFEASTVDGAAFEGASVAGKPVVLWFWAPWCAVCRSQVPEVEDLAEEYADQVTFLGIGSLDSSFAIEDFAGDVEGITHLSDPDGELWARFEIAEQSSFVVLDAAGQEALRTGYSDYDALAGVVAEVAGG